MIWNIIDRRKHPYRFLRVTAIAEPTWHDNSCKDADQAPKYDNEGIGYIEWPVLSVAEAVAWAGKLRYAVTLYLYDEGEGIKEVSHESDTDQRRPAQSPPA